MKGILIVDHGSRKDEANEMLPQMAEVIQRLAGQDVIVRHAHMELSDPDIAEGIADCVSAGVAFFVLSSCK